MTAVSAETARLQDDEICVPRRRVELSDLQPFLRWPGGKRLLVSYLLEHLPDQYGRYFEPFLGGGALFFALNPAASVLSDRSVPLIECYQAIKTAPRQVLRSLYGLRNSEEDYYRIRDKVRPRTTHGRAARLIYLSALAFNGIYRENLQGHFNVPYGGKTARRVTAGLRLQEVSDRLASAEVRCGDFDAVLEDASAGDLIYLDPPYTVAHSNNGFVKYNAQIFSWEDQRRLAATASRLVARGCHIIMTNAYHKSILELYAGFTPHRIQRFSRVSASRKARGSVYEYILTS